MSKSKRIVRRVFTTIFGIVLICGVGTCVYVTSSMGKSIPEELSVAYADTFNTTIRPELATWKVLRNYDLSEPYNVVGDVDVSDGQVSCVLLDNIYRELSFTIGKEDGKYVTQALYLTPEESKQSVDKLVKLMFGEDVVYTISDIYDEYVTVNVRGDMYRWKDGTLERVR